MGNKPHQHAEFIKAWADGKEIQFSCGDNFWYDLIDPPVWQALRYRIKPEPTPLWQVIRDAWYASGPEILSNTLRSPPDRWIAAADAVEKAIKERQ